MGEANEVDSTSAARATQSLQAGPTLAGWLLRDVLLLAGFTAVLSAAELASGAIGGGFFYAATAVLGFIAAYAACYMVHEWGHYLGARAAGASLPLGPYRGVLLGLFDTRAHTRRQFQMMSLGGISGYVLTALCCLGIFTALGGGAAAGGLLSGGVAFVLQSLSVDLPIVWRVQRGADVAPTAAQGATARIILRRTAVSWLLLLLAALIWWWTW